MQVPLRGLTNDDQLEQTFAYPMKISAPLNAMRLGLDLAYDPAAGSLVISRSDAQIGPGNRMALTARLGGLPTDVTPGQLLPKDLLATGAIHALDLTLANSGLFENSTVTWLMMIYPALGDTPEEAVQQAQSLSRDWIATIPDSLTTAR